MNLTRKFFHSHIQQLESLFRAGSDDVELLQELQNELMYRQTWRAARLRIDVAQRLTELKSGIQSSDSVSPGPQNTASREAELGSYQSEGVHSLISTNVLSEPFVVERRATVPPLIPLKDSRPENVLSAWTALEVLSPPAYNRPEDLAAGEQRRVAKFSNSSLPWEVSEKSKPNFKLYYQIVLGSIKMGSAVEKLIARYGDARPEKPSARGKAALAVVIVDSKGRLTASPAVGISSFSWGVTAALNGDLADLARWPDVEPQLVERIEKLLLGNTSGGDPINRATLFNAYETLVSELGLPKDWVEEPAFAIRSYVYFKDPNPPEPLLLNSFFLTDLALAQKLFSEGKPPQNLRRYLGVQRPQKTQDLLRDPAALEEAVSPALTNLSRWPNKGRHPLVLLQQAAVNLVFRETQAGGLLGINGPPGTGKTTLLRDVVAGVVTARAEAMAKFDDPEKAFEHSGEKLKAGDKAWLHLYRLNPSLRGFEIVVASSNNKAVENVSAELPGISAIAEDASDLRYFKTLSDALHKSDTWGAIAAVLGNAQNRSRFKQTFWWDDDKGLNCYLRVAASSVPPGAQPNSQSGQTKPPQIVLVEKPPSSHQEALERWKSARERFLRAIEKSRQWQVALEKLRADLAQLPALAQAEASADLNRNDAAEIVRQLDIVAVTAGQAKIEASQQLHLADQELHAHGLVKPGFWARLFRTSIAREWSGKLASLRANQREAQMQHNKLVAERKRIEDELRQALLHQQNAESAWQTACEQHHQTKQRLAEATQKYGIVLADAKFFALEHRRRQQMTPWFIAEVQRLRDEVFISAMALHRAFVDAAAKPLRHNLGALMNVFTTQTLPDAQKQALLSDLWASLFLVVPLVSTTFASVNRMLGKLPLESLGWLLVDEAGQALPQAAVGAILRTRRAVIVGDPVQIEPVVVLPAELTSAICRQFGVDPDHYAASTASVQTLADAASAYSSEFQTNVSSRSVGVPLLVHRRCSEPMFGVSNSIAYSGLMVPAKSPKPSTIRDVLGPSRWIHVEGRGVDKWCREEGAEVLCLLSKLAQLGVNPDLYIITPFVIVADQLRQVVRESQVLKGWVNEDEWRWTQERIGTVHTVQGREAEAVIFVLGAPYPAQTGARGWAGGRPNLLNVAVTRAKEALYIIGNRQLWRDAGLFRELDKRVQ